MYTVTAAEIPYMYALGYTSDSVGLNLCTLAAFSIQLALQNNTQNSLIILHTIQGVQ